MSLFTDAQKVIAGGVNSPVRAFASVGGEPVFFISALSGKKDQTGQGGQIECQLTDCQAAPQKSFDMFCQYLIKPSDDLTHIGIPFLCSISHDGLPFLFIAFCAEVFQYPTQFPHVNS